MEKIVFANVLVIMWFVTFYYIMQARKKQGKLANTFFRTLIWSEIAITSYIFILMFDYYCIISFFYSIFFICMDWLLFSLLEFSWEYTSMQYTKIRIWRKILVFILSVDSFSLFFNPVFEHAVSYETQIIDGKMYLIFQEKLLYDCHLMICYIMSAFIFYILIKKVFNSPHLYKRRYLTSLLVVLFVIAVNGAFLLFHLKIDVSVAFYSIASIWLYNNVFTFQPHRLLTDTMTTAMRDSTDAFILFDMNNKRIWENNRMIRIIHKSETLDVVCELCQVTKNELAQKNETKRLLIQTEQGNLYFDLEYQEMYDKKKRYMGCFCLFHDVTKETEYSMQQEYLANHDAFTGVYNKRYFYNKVVDMLSRPENQDETFYMMVSNVRNFKFINETFGQEVGDQVIQKIASTIQDVVPLDAIYGRLENDKFAICMRKSEFSEINFINDSKKMLNLKGEPLPVKQYLGVYEITDREIAVDIMCDRAVLALNAIKGNYNETIGFFNQDLRNMVKEELEITSDFESAILNGEFQVYLQGQFDHVKKTIVGAEALVRWKHPQKGMIAPDVFIPVLEKNSLIARLDLHVWEMVCQILQKWRRLGWENCSISVNISPKDLYLMDIHEVLNCLIEKYDLLPRMLKIEITESSFMTDIHRQVALITRLQEEGFVVEMDDFGSGYSSLNSLKDIPIDVLKMDMKFFEETQNSSKSGKILKAIVELAQELELLVIAEGVEKSEQADFLAKIGCTTIQGFLYARPLPLEEFELLAKNYEEKKK